MSVTIDKQGKINMSLGAVVAILLSIPTAYVSARAALGQAMKEQIKEEIKPLTDAFEVTLQQNVRSLRNTIAALEFKRDMCGSTLDCWTVRDAQDLANAREDLKAAELALAGIKDN